MTHALGIGYDVHKKNCLVTIFLISLLLWHFPFEFLDFGKDRGKWCFRGLNKGRFGGKKWTKGGTFQK